VTPSSSTVSELRELAIFAGLPDDLLEWLLAHGEVQQYDHGEVVLDDGDVADYMYVILEGTVHIHVQDGGQLLNAVTYYKGKVTGLLPYSRMKIIEARVIIGEPARILRIHRDQFADMLHRSPDLGQRLVATMSDRVREQTKLAQQREKMMALGKLSAGLAHELNNPATAITRAADALRERFHVLKSVVAPMVASEMTKEHFEALKQCRQSAFERGSPKDLSPLQRGRREEAIGDWLEDHGVADAWKLSETYVDAGLTAEELNQWAAALPPQALPHVLRWLEASLSADRILSEIAAAAGRISQLVASVKQYSHMDAMPDKQPVDVREGLDSTLTMLGHEIKTHHVKVERAYDDNLPKVAAYPGELNQVWTNLIDNAIDAAPKEGGQLRVEALREDHVVVVKIIDNGHGIPSETQSRIFEPFFSTKPVGEGTGLGLDIAQRIVSQHGGKIAVESKPGATVFTVYLPLA
jgi:signal transduction histidine kinase